MRSWTEDEINRACAQLPGESKYTPEDDRRMLELRALGLTYAQVGEALGLPESSVKNRLHRRAEACRAEINRARGIPIERRIQEEAERRGVSRQQLVSMVMDSVAVHQLWDAIL